MSKKAPSPARLSIIAAALLAASMMVGLSTSFADTTKNNNQQTQTQNTAAQAKVQNATQQSTKAQQTQQTQQANARMAASTESLKQKFNDKSGANQAATTQKTAATTTTAQKTTELQSIKQAQQAKAAEQAAWRNTQKSDKHYARKAAGVGATSEATYTAQARETISKGEQFAYTDTKSKQARIGYYMKQNNWFAATSRTKEGGVTLHTYFAPKRHGEYIADLKSGRNLTRQEEDEF